MRIDCAMLRQVEMPLKFRFRTSFGEIGVKKFLLLELRAEGLAGWGECVAEEGPFYSPEALCTASRSATFSRKRRASPSGHRSEARAR